MNYFISIIAFLTPLFTICQLDSTYQSFYKETSFQKVYLFNNKLSLLGKYSEQPQQDFPFFSYITIDLKRQLTKKLEEAEYFDYCRFSENSIDKSILKLGYNINSRTYRNLARYSDSGKRLFSINISSDSLYFTRKIIQTSDSGYLLTGYGINSSLKAYCFLLKVSVSGKIIWLKNYQPDWPYNFLGTGIYEQNNSYYLLIEAEKDKMDSPYFHQENIIYKLDKAGNLISTMKTTDSITFLTSCNFNVDKDENVIYTGYRYQKLIFDTPNNILQMINRPYIICKDKNNKIKWELPIQKNQTGWHGLQTLKKLSDGNYLAVGDYYNAYGSDSSKSAYAIKFDKTGKKIWERTYRRSVLSYGNNDNFSDFIELEDNTSILIGTSFQYFNEDGNVNNFGKRQYGWAIRIDKNGEILKQSPSNVDILENVDAISIYPNPFINQFKIKVNSTKVPLFHIYDNCGRILNLNQFQFLFTNQELEITLNSNLSSGLYFLKIVVDDLEKTYKIEKKEF